MDEASSTVVRTVQSSVDAKAYPPTHTYDVASLTPTGVLAERVRVLLTLCPDFFRAERFLDVGASKGFFSLRAARESGHVLALDPDAEALAAWAPVCPGNVEQRVGTFSDLGGRGWYDMVWIGNGHHYLHREDPEWTQRLKWLAADRVVVEGPVGKHAQGFADWAEGTVPEEAEFLAAAEAASFRLVATAKSPTYTPGRAVWYLRKIGS